jgi:hypothetical protein
MMGTGPVDALIATIPGWRGAALASIREVVRRADPAIGEDVKWKRPGNPNGSIVWDHGGIVCIGIVLKERVRLSFPAGSKLPDPAKLFNAQLNGVSRAIDLSSDARLDRRALAALVRSAVARNVAKAGAGRARHGADRGSGRAQS